MAAFDRENRIIGESDKKSVKIGKNAGFLGRSALPRVRDRNCHPRAFLPHFLLLCCRYTAITVTSFLALW
jgi:hypothetical protein